jgi:hypothetical protein
VVDVLERLFADSVVVSSASSILRFLETLVLRSLSEEDEVDEYEIEEDGLEEMEGWLGVNGVELDVEEVDKVCFDDFSTWSPPKGAGEDIFVASR